MEAIYQVSQDPNRQRAAELAGIHRNSVKNYIKQYNKGGLEALCCFEYKGFVSLLGGHRVTLEAYFKEHPPRTAKEAAFRVEAITKERLGIDEVRRFMHKIGMKPRKQVMCQQRQMPNLNSFLLGILHRRRVVLLIG